MQRQQQDAPPPPLITTPATTTTPSCWWDDIGGIAGADEDARAGVCRGGVEDDDDMLVDLDLGLDPDLDLEMDLERLLNPSPKEGSVRDGGEKKSHAESVRIVVSPSSSSPGCFGDAMRHPAPAPAPAADSDPFLLLMEDIGMDVDTTAGMRERHRYDHSTTNIAATDAMRALLSSWQGPSPSDVTPPGRMTRASSTSAVGVCTESHHHHDHATRSRRHSLEDNVLLRGSGAAAASQYEHTRSPQSQHSPLRAPQPTAPHVAPPVQALFGRLATRDAPTTTAAPGTGPLPLPPPLPLPLSTSNITTASPQHHLHRSRSEGSAPALHTSTFSSISTAAAKPLLLPFHGVTRQRWTTRFEARLPLGSTSTTSITSSSSLSSLSSLMPAQGCGKDFEEATTSPSAPLYLGAYDTAERAARAYDLALLALHPDDAHPPSFQRATNFPAPSYPRETLSALRDIIQRARSRSDRSDLSALVSALQEGKGLAAGVGPGAAQVHGNQQHATAGPPGPSTSGGGRRRGRS
eukprot:jgi/Chlat1/3770/Chrsp259S03943